MKKAWWLFFFCLFAGLGLLWFFTSDEEALSDVPVTIPNRSQIVPPGTQAAISFKTSDEGRIPQLMQPSSFVRTSTDKVIAAGCSHGTDKCKVQVVYDYVRLNYEYRVSSPEHTYIQPPAETLIYGSGDEMELAILIASMHQSGGYRSEILRGPYHVFVRTYVENKSYIMDPSCQGCHFEDVRVQLSGTEDIFR